MIRRIFSLGIRAEVLMLVFSAGAVCGMLFEAVLMTFPRLAFLIVRSVF